MKQNEISLNSLLIDSDRFLLTDEEIGDNHVATSIDTPMREDAFDLSDLEKIKIIEGHFREIMLTLGLDLTDDSLRGTPNRVAKMYIEEIFSGLNPKNEPKVALFENKYGYKEMLIEKNISFYSNCEHHFVVIDGLATVAYVPNKKVLGLSKINRIVEYFSKRPQIQERLTEQIFHALCYILDTSDVAVMIDAQHYCVKSRGVEDTGSSTVTVRLGGGFRSDPAARNEFLSIARMGK
jgi:GTP cyclohydrolase I